MQEKSIKENRAGRRSVKQWIALGLVIIGIPAVLLLSWQMGDRKYYLTSMLVLLCAVAAFWLSFERRRPKTREMVLIAVMCAIAVASRAAFIMFPQFKPIVGIVMICGMALGPQAGFMTGSISAFVSNFIFGQGAWTPWQMFAFGLAGLLAGYLCRAGVMTSGRRLVTALIGGGMILVLIGPILDTCTLFTMSSVINTESVGAVYSVGAAVQCYARGGGISDPAYSGASDDRKTGSHQSQVWTYGSGVDYEIQQLSSCDQFDIFCGSADRDHSVSSSGFPGYFVCGVFCLVGEAARKARIDLRSVPGASDPAVCRGVCVL